MINIIAYQIMCTALISFVKNHMHNEIAVTILSELRKHSQSIKFKNTIKIKDQSGRSHRYLIFIIQKKINRHVFTIRIFPSFNILIHIFFKNILMKNVFTSVIQKISLMVKKLNLKFKKTLYHVFKKLFFDGILWLL